MNLDESEVDLRNMTIGRFLVENGEDERAATNMLMVLKPSLSLDQASGIISGYVLPDNETYIMMDLWVTNRDLKRIIAGYRKQVSILRSHSRPAFSAARREVTV